MSEIRYINVQLKLSMIYGKIKTYTRSPRKHPMFFGKLDEKRKDITPASRMQTHFYRSRGAHRQMSQLRPATVKVGLITVEHKLSSTHCGSSQTICNSVDRNDGVNSIIVSRQKHARSCLMLTDCHCHYSKISLLFSNFTFYCYIPEL